MSKDKFPITPAIRVLRAHKVEFTPHLYEYEEHGGTEVASRELGVDEHATVKTIILQDGYKKPLIVLMTGSFSAMRACQIGQIKSSAPLCNN